MPVRVSRRSLLGGLAASSVACGADRGAPGKEANAAEPRPTSGPVTSTGRPPNIVFVFVDQMRGGAFGAAGDPAAVTPNLDGLAASSVQFSRFFTNGAICVPARAAMMTGLYPFQTGMLKNEVPNPSMPNHVRRLRDEAGYHTMLVGKFHLHKTGEHMDVYKPIVQEFGFTDAIELPGPKGAADFASAYSDWLTATTPEGETDKWERYARYIDQYDWFSRPPDDEPWGLSTEDHLDQFCARTAADWIRAYDRDEPFYLQVNFPGPHKPFNATSEFRQLYDVETTPFPPAILVVPDKPAPLVEQYLGIKYEPWTRNDQRELALAYYATISLVDDAIGQVIRALEDAGRMDDTWIVFASDHGELLGDFFMTGKVVFYESAIHVPLVIRPPGGTDPWVCAGLCGTVDLTSTLQEIAGLGNDETQPGISTLGKVLAGPGAPDAQVLRTEVLGGDCGYYFLRDERWRATWDPANNAIDELYDLLADPDEIHNLRSSAEHEDVRQDFLARFAAYYETWPIVDVRSGEIMDDTG